MTMTAAETRTTEEGIRALETAKALQDQIDERIAKGGEPATAEETRSIMRAMDTYTHKVIERESDRNNELALLEDLTSQADEELRAEAASDGPAVVTRDDDWRRREDTPRIDTRSLPVLDAEAREQVFRGVQANVVPLSGRGIFEERSPFISNGDLEARAHSTGTPAAGGNTFIAGWVDDFYSMVEQYQGFMSTMPTLLTTDHGRDLKWPTLSQFGTAAAVAEGGTLAGNDLKFGQFTLSAYKVARYTKVTRELFEDADVPLDRILAQDFGRSVAKVLDSWFVTGTGTVQPDGILGNEGGTVTGGTGVAGVPSFDNLIDLTYAIDHDVLAENNCCFLTHHKTVGQIAKLKDNDGQYLWRPRLTEPTPRELLGYQVKTSPHVPETGTNKTSVFFGDFRRAMVVRMVNSARFERSEHFLFNTDETALRITLRADSKVRDSSAVHCYRGATS